MRAPPGSFIENFSPIGVFFKMLIPMTCKIGQFLSWIQTIMFFSSKKFWTQVFSTKSRVFMTCECFLFKKYPICNVKETNRFPKSFSQTGRRFSIFWKYRKKLIVSEKKLVLWLYDLFSVCGYEFLFTILVYPVSECIFTSKNFLPELVFLWSPQ